MSWNKTWHYLGLMLTQKYLIYLFNQNPIKKKKKHWLWADRTEKAKMENLFWLDNTSSLRHPLYILAHMHVKVLIFPNVLIKQSRADIFYTALFYPVVHCCFVLTPSKPLKAYDEWWCMDERWGLENVRDELCSQQTQTGSSVMLLPDNS